MKGRAALTLLLVALSFPAEARQARSQKVVREFARLVPCPLSGPGTCFQKGFEADHRTPICAGGKDEVWNLQWLTIEDHDIKTRLDMKWCRALRRARG